MSAVGTILFIAQGASPGFIVNQHILSPVGAALPATNTRAESAAPRRSSFLFCMYLPRVSYQALPSFHPGLCRSTVPEGTRN